jgi:hypothetical protein
LKASSGAYTFSGDCDGVLRLWLDEALVLDKSDRCRREARGSTRLAAGRSYRVRIDYVHGVGDSSNHVSWSGPGFGRRILTLTRGAAEDSKAAGPKP